MTKPVIYKRHRFPPGVITRDDWLYLRLSLNLRIVEGRLLERGIIASYETIRRWGRKFRPDYARRLHPKPPRPADIWHLDEVVISISGKKHWLLHAVDQDGYVLDEIVHSHCNTKAAKRIIIDKVPSYGGTRRQVMPRI